MNNHLLYRALFASRDWFRVDVGKATRIFSLTHLTALCVRGVFDLDGFSPGRKAQDGSTWCGHNKRALWINAVPSTPSAEYATSYVCKCLGGLWVVQEHEKGGGIPSTWLSYSTAETCSIIGEERPGLMWIDNVLETTSPHPQLRGPLLGCSLTLAEVSRDGP
jgi:hypothetical protein